MNGCREVAARTLSGRNAPYLSRRARSIAGRYGVSPRKAQERTRRCVQSLASHGLLPTFATPGEVVERHPAFFRQLSDMGVEMAVHGYEHVDFRRLSHDAARKEFARATEAYERAGVPYEGFRCPYLSYAPELGPALPPDVFSYSSNEAVGWDVVADAAENPVFAQLASFYAARPSREAVCTPAMTDGLVEVPASVPDDLQLWDALALDSASLARAWGDVLRQVHRRSELFAPLFHPESFDLIRDAAEEVVRSARALQPGVWLTQLRAVARWWRERTRFAVHRSARGRELGLTFECGERATVLVRDWPWGGAPSPWDERWAVLPARSIDIEDRPRPFVGIRGVDAGTTAFLEEQGYVIDSSEEAEACTVVLDPRIVRDLPNRVSLMDHIEASSGPLVRFSRWPAGAKAALCFAGDLDALSLLDYGRRLLPPGVRHRRRQP